MPCACRPSARNRCYTVGIVSSGSLLQISQDIEMLKKSNEGKIYHIDTILQRDVGQGQLTVEMSSQQEAIFERDYASCFEAALKKAISKKRLDEPVKKRADRISAKVRLEGYTPWLMAQIDVCLAWH